MQIGIKIYAFIACDDEDVKIYEVSDPSNPQFVCNLFTGVVTDVSTLQIGVKIYLLIAFEEYYAGVKIVEFIDL